MRDIKLCAQLPEKCDGKWLSVKCLVEKAQRLMQVAFKRPIHCLRLKLLHAQAYTDQHIQKASFKV